MESGEGLPLPAGSDQRCTSSPTETSSASTSGLASCLVDILRLLKMSSSSKTLLLFSDVIFTTKQFLVTVVEIQTAQNVIATVVEVSPNF